MQCISNVVTLLVAIPATLGNFGYSKHEQHVWPQKFASCSGKMQSPVAISPFHTVVLPLPALEMVGYHNTFLEPLTLKNNGHSATINIETNSMTARSPYIFGGMLKSNQEYIIESLHFHWGKRNDRGSEHVLNGIRFPMEMHIIHRNKIYSNFSHALNYEDGICVLAIFFQLQEEDNLRLSALTNSLASIKWVNTDVQIDNLFTLALLIPHNTEAFYTYKGSLTSPPCNEAVTWIIFSTPVPISFQQMNRFRMLSNGKGNLVDNYRILQDIGLRKIYARKLIPFGRKKLIMSSLNITKLNWFWQ